VTTRERALKIAHAVAVARGFSFGLDVLTALVGDGSKIGREFAAEVAAIEAGLAADRAAFAESLCMVARAAVVTGKELAR
jgi:hypothetical protein